MSLVVVTGFGPRTGTSFVMNQARLKGLPIKGQAFIDGLTIPQHNPDGYWESTSNDLTDVITSSKRSIIKLWYPVLQQLDADIISCIVVLERRNKLAQMHSIYKTFKSECALTPSLYSILETVEDFHTHYDGLNSLVNKLNKTKVMRVYTEDLNESISDELCFLERGLTWL